MTAAVAIASDDQYRVLRAYAAGADLRSTAASLSMDLERVSGIVETVGFNRSHARTLVQDYERRRSAQPPLVEPSPREPEKPEIVVTTTPAAPTYEGLLDRADSSGDPKLEKLAAKARELLDELEDRLTAFEEAQEALAEIAELEAKLEAARSKLISHRPSQRTGPDPKAVRAWAAENGVACGQAGRPPKSVIDAYLAAQGPSS